MTDPSDKDIPLVVDLDGTLIRSDLLMESFWRGMGLDPVGTLRTAFGNLSQRAALKQGLAAHSAPIIDRLPVDPDVAAFLDDARAQGRQVFLVSGANEALVAQVAEEYGPFDGYAGSDGERNLTATRKRDYLIERFGAGNFDYIGDSRADLEVWAAARRAIVARPSGGLTRALAEQKIEAQTLGRHWQARDLVNGTRPHQWLKNLLLVLPLMAAHRTDVAGFVAVALGVIAFSALASAIYIVNDLTDLDADRQHEKKCHRPFASGAVPIRVGMVASVALGLFGLAVGASLGTWMVVVLLVYLVSTLSYSMRLKRVRWADVTMLASLYTLRVIAGAVATGVAASGWLIGFIFPVFLSLGCVKRLTELGRAKTDGYLPGRRYRSADRQDLLNVAIIAALAAIGVFMAYTFSMTAQELYPRLWMLWVVAGLLALWLVRMIQTGWRGQQDYDPIIYAITDRRGVAIVLVAFTFLILASN